MLARMLCLVAVCLALAAAIPMSAQNLDASSPFELVIGLPHRDTAKLDEIFDATFDPSSPSYLKYPTLETLRDAHGADSNTISKVMHWLISDGAEPSSIHVSALHDTVTASFPSVPQRWGNKLHPTKESVPVPVDFILRRDPKIAGDDLSQPKKNSTKNFLNPKLGYSIPAQKRAYGIPTDLVATNETSLQMVWGPGTFGYSHTELESLKLTQCPKLNTSRVVYDTKNHGEKGGDNFGEGTLDTCMISAFGLNIETIVSNTNTSASTEEGNGFGQALLDFVSELPSRKVVPHVLSLSLGSLSGASCDLLCDEAVKKGADRSECEDFLQQQRQVCMYLSEEQVGRINRGFQLLGLRGVSIFGSSGDGGSHFSFGPFQGGDMADTLNDISCEFQMPVFPTSSPYIISVGGTAWEGDSGSRPVAWGGSGGGFSWQFARPSHQETVVKQYLATTQGLPPTTSFNSTGRAYPDVAAVSHDGTSQSSPTTAGIWSLLMDSRLNNNLPPLGFLAPRIWKVAQEYPGEAFEDITEGNTQTECDNGFPATKGWDPTTGWGRPVWDGMMKHFGTDDSLTKTK